MNAPFGEVDEARRLSLSLLLYRQSCSFHQVNESKKYKFGSFTIEPLHPFPKAAKLRCRPRPHHNDHPPFCRRRNLIAQLRLVLRAGHYQVVEHFAGQAHDGALVHELKGDADRKVDKDMLSLYFVRRDSNRLLMPKKALAAKRCGLHRGLG